MSREVAALLHDDHDLADHITEDDKRALLRAAQSSAHPQQTGTDAFDRRSTFAGGANDWTKLEKETRERRAANEATLKATRVYAGHDGMYHLSGCASLIASVFDSRGNVIGHRFDGSEMTLAAARDAGMHPHSRCGPPSYEYHDAPRLLQ